MHQDKRNQCQSILDTLTNQNLTLEDLLIQALLTRKEQLLDLIKSFPDEPSYQEELKEVRTQLLNFGE